jgi:thiol:disulfide interchange protein
MKKALLLAVMTAGLLVFAEPVCIDGMCYPSREDAIAAGVKLPEKADKTHAPSGTRLAMGFMKSAEMVSFLANEKTEAPFAGHSVFAIFLLAVLGGLALNLTPCVLPLMPINLAIIGAGVKARSKLDGAKRGGAYGLGIALTYGALGLLAAFGGVAFGTIQSSPYFNSAIAIAFAVLALAMADVFSIDFSKYRKRGAAPRTGTAPVWSVAGMGALSALLAGACVSPILIAVLMVAATGVGDGNFFMALLPFALGLGMALPWPLAGAGIAALPKPGAWMVAMKKIFAAAIFAFAVWYGCLAWRGFFPADAARESGSTVAVPAEWDKAFAEAKAKGKPVFVDIWASWCKNCSAMEKTTLRDREVVKQLEKFTVLKLQAEDISALRKLKGFENLKVTGLPAFVVFE